MEKIRLLIIDDEKLIREGLKIILSTYEDLEVIGMGEDGYEALELCKKNDVDLVLMDIRMPRCDGVLGTKIIKENFPKVKILILTTFRDMEYIQKALKYGASGYLLKDSSYDLIYNGIRASVKGNIVIHPEIASQIISNSSVTVNHNDLDKYNLSEKEINIIQALAQGLSNKEIGEKLYLSEGTIKNNLSNILSKLGLRDRTQLVIFAFKHGLAK